MSDPKHTPLVHLGVELDDEEAQDVIDTLQDLADSQERDIERLAEALKDSTAAIEAALRDAHIVSDDLLALLRGARDAARAALREAGVS